MDVEMVFRDIDADGIVLHLFRASACHSGLSPGYPFRPKEKTRAIQLSRDPSNGLRVPDPTLAAVERAATLSQRSLLASAARKVIRQAGISRTSSPPDG
jgi:hypothetical protein